MGPRTDRPIRVTVLNDYPVVVSGVTAMLAPHRDRVEMVEQGRGSDLPRDVDVVLYDTFAMVDDRTREIARKVAVHRAELVVFSWSTDPTLVRQSIDAGARGFLSKSLEPDEVVAGLERVHSGAMVAPRPGEGGQVTQRGDWPGSEHGLSARESEVVALIARGLSNQEIAELTFLSINSVKTYIRTAYRKMDVNTRSQAVLWGLRNGFDPLARS